MGCEGINLLPSPVYWFAKAGQKKLGGVLKDPTGLQRLVGKLKDWDVYAGINQAAPLRGRIRARAEDVQVLRAVLLDVDPIEVGAQPEKAADAFLRGAEAILGPGLKPARVNTGRGYQLWLRLPEKDVSSAAAKSLWGGRVRGLVRHIAATGLQFGCRLDPAVTDLPRLVRVPGSVNQRTGVVARVEDPGEINELAEDCWQWAEAEPTPAWLHPTICAWNQAYSHLGKRLQRYVLYGVNEGSRNETAFLLAAVLRDMGVARDGIEEAVMVGASRCSPAMDYYEALSCINSALKRPGKARNEDVYGIEPARRGPSQSAGDDETSNPGQREPILQEG